jgi:hypothetical protein
MIMGASHGPRYIGATPINARNWNLLQEMRLEFGGSGRRLEIRIGGLVTAWTLDLVSAQTKAPQTKTSVSAEQQKISII